MVESLIHVQINPKSWFADALGNLVERPAPNVAPLEPAAVNFTTVAELVEFGVNDKRYLIAYGWYRDELGPSSDRARLLFETDLSRANRDERVAGWTEVARARGATLVLLDSESRGAANAILPMGGVSAEAAAVVAAFGYSGTLWDEPYSRKISVDSETFVTRVEFDLATRTYAVHMTS